MCINSTCITFSLPSKLLPVSTTHPGPHNALVTRLRFKLSSFYYKFGLASVRIPGLGTVYTKPPAQVLVYSWCWIDYRFSFFPSPPALSLLLVYWTPARSKQTYWQSVWVIFRMCMCACVCLVCTHACMGERERGCSENIWQAAGDAGQPLVFICTASEPVSASHQLVWRLDLLTGTWFQYSSSWPVSQVYLFPCLLLQFL